MRRPEIGYLRASNLTRRLTLAASVWLALPSLRAVEAKPTPVTSPTPPPASTRAVMQTAMKQAFTYDPSVHQKAEALKKKIAEDGVLQLEAVVVNEDSKNNPNFNRYMERQRQIKAAEKPSVATGASVKTRAAEVGVRLYVDEMPFGPPTPRWSLIKMPW